MATRICNVSGESFVVSEFEQQLREKLESPAPTLAPTERRRRRLARRNDRNLFRRQCSRSGESIISMYPSQTAFPVYSKEFWWSEAWDPLSYGKNFDFGRTFFEQFLELQNSVPRPALNVMANENSDYVNQCGYSKDCYLSFCTDFSEGCLYCTNVLRSRDCVDVLNAENCELCYECMDCRSCYSCSFLTNCSNCSDSAFLRNCIGCAYCFGCTNLRNKEYYFFNTALSKDQYHQAVTQWWKGSFSALTELRNKFGEVVASSVLPHAELIRCEDVTGDQLRDCKSTFFCFDSFSDQDVANCTTLSDAKDVVDFDIGGYGAERCLEVLGSGFGLFDCYYSSNLWEAARNVYYCDMMHQVDHCFGSIGLRRANHVILNKQYSEDEYFALRARVIEHMKQTGEWGQFFPAQMSPFPYDTSFAGYMQPLSQAEATDRGYAWRGEESVFDTKVSSQAPIPQLTMPDNINDYSDTVAPAILTCSITGKAFRLQQAELNFYRRQGLPIPRVCPDERHRQRLQARNPWHLWERSCSLCGNSVQSSFSREKRNGIACRDCYEKEVAQ